MIARLPAALACLVAGCHVTTSSIEDLRGRRTLHPHLDRAVAKDETVELTPDGRLRLVEALVCPSDLMTEVSRYEVVNREPNLATAILGVIAGSLGVVSLVVGLSADDPAGAPTTWLGLAGVAVGAPLVIGPLRGNGTEENLLSSATVAVGTRSAPCGSRPLPDRAAELRFGPVWVAGGVDGQGLFAVSPFHLVDAFALARAPALAVAVKTGGAAAQPFATSFSAEELAGARDGFLRAAGIDGRVEPLSKLPGLRAGDLTVSITEVDGRPAAAVGLHIGNVGPGPAYQVRGVLVSIYPQLDGRIFYIGYLPAGVDAAARLIIPLSSPDLDLGQARLMIKLRDAHETTPTAPLPLKRPR